MTIGALAPTAFALDRYQTFKKTPNPIKSQGQ
jgi:hypothetical protein